MKQEKSWTQHEVHEEPIMRWRNLLDAAFRLRPESPESLLLLAPPRVLLRKFFFNDFFGLDPPTLSARLLELQ